MAAAASQGDEHLQWFAWRSFWVSTALSAICHVATATLHLFTSSARVDHVDALVYVRTSPPVTSLTTHEKSSPPSPPRLFLPLRRVSARTARQSIRCGSLCQRSWWCSVYHANRRCSQKSPYETLPPRRGSLSIKLHTIVRTSALCSERHGKSRAGMPSGMSRSWPTARCR